jgi:multicomponent Na+:H+ antiporter subunit D
MLPYPVDYEPYTSYHVSETLLVLLFTAVGFFLLLKKLEPTPTISLDLDWPYRMGGRAFHWLARRPVQAIDNFVGEIYRYAGTIPLMFTANVVRVFDTHFIDGIVDGFADGFRRAGVRLRAAQRGALQENLAVTFAVAAVVVLAFLFLF